jgi:hypothetical protein
MWFYEVGGFCWKLCTYCVAGLERLSRRLIFASTNELGKTAATVEASAVVASNSAGNSAIGETMGKSKKKRGGGFSKVTNEGFDEKLVCATSLSSGFWHLVDGSVLGSLSLPECWAHRTEDSRWQLMQSIGGIVLFGRPKSSKRCWKVRRGQWLSPGSAL